MQHLNGNLCKTNGNDWKFQKWIKDVLVWGATRKNSRNNRFNLNLFKLHITFLLDKALNVW